MNGGCARWLLVSACCLLAGCGYSTSTLLRQDIRSISVPVFDNRTWYHGLEVELTRAVVEEVKLHTRLHFAPPGEADSALEGELVSFEQEAPVKTREQDIVLARVTVEVRFRWVDNLTRRDIVPRQSVRETQLYAVPLGGPPESLAFREVAKRIVEKMERDW